MSAEKKVPEIRFKGFSGDWLNNPIGEICGSTFGGGTPSTSEKSFWQGDIPWIQSSDLKEGSVNSVTAKKHITKAGVNKSATKLVSGNSIAIVTRVGVGKLSLMESEYATSQDFLSLSDLKVDTQYSAYVIWKLLQIEKEQVQGTSIKGITKEELLSKTISFPEAKLEQIAIGNTFQKLDSLISQHQQKHDQLSNIKKAMLEKMFPKQGETTPEIRFKGFSGEWEEKPLSEIAQVIDPHPSHRAPDAVDNGVPFIGIGDISDAGLVDFKNVRIVSRHIYIEHSARYTIENGDFAYGRVASVGKIIDLSNNVGKEYTYSPTMAIIKPKILYPVFLKSYLGTEVFKVHVDNKTSGSTRKSLGVQDFRNLPVLFPLVDEQTAIGNYFQKLDTLINQHQNQITKLNNIKQACLSKMFV